MNIMLIFWIGLAMVFYTIGEYFSKLYAGTSIKLYAGVALVGYFINAACFLPAILKFNSLSILGTIWNLCYVIVTLVVGIFVFQETLTITQIVGVVFAFISVVLLSI